MRERVVIAHLRSLRVEASDAKIVKLELETQVVFNTDRSPGTEIALGNQVRRDSPKCTGIHIWRISPFPPLSHR